jgi:hypothetical protein
MNQGSAKPENAAGPHSEVDEEISSAIDDPELPDAEKTQRLSQELRDMLPYFGQLVTVHLTFPLAQIDYAGATEMIINPAGDRVQMPFTADAIFVRRDPMSPNGVEVLPPRAMDVIHNVLLQPAPCGKRIMVLQTMEGSEDRAQQSGAIISHVVFPNQILCISQVAVPPTKGARSKEGSRIVAP